MRNIESLYCGSLARAEHVGLATLHVYRRRYNRSIHNFHDDDNDDDANNSHDVVHEYLASGLFHGLAPVQHYPFRAGVATLLV